MEKENKTKEKPENAEKLCCADKNVCSVDCSPKSKKKEHKCGCGGCC